MSRYSFCWLDATATSTAAGSTAPPALGALFGAKPTGTTTGLTSTTPSLGATASTTAGACVFHRIGGASVGGLLRSRSLDVSLVIQRGD